MDTFAQNLKHNIVNATTAQDLFPIVSAIELDKLKHLLLEQTVENDQSIDVYFKSLSILDIFGADVINHFLSYLQINELYHTKSVCKSFEKINKSILSSNNIYKNYENYNKQFRLFREWYKKEYKKHSENKYWQIY